MLLFIMLFGTDLALEHRQKTNCTQFDAQAHQPRMLSRVSRTHPVLGVSALASLVTSLGQLQRPGHRIDARLVVWNLILPGSEHSRAPRDRSCREPNLVRFFGRTVIIHVHQQEGGCLSGISQA